MDRTQMQRVLPKSWCLSTTVHGVTPEHTGNFHIISRVSPRFRSSRSLSCIVYELRSVELSLKMNLNETPPLFYCVPPHAPLGVVTVTCTSEWPRDGT